MARPKGSKNKTRTVKAAVDYAAVVAEKTAEKEKKSASPKKNCACRIPGGGGNILVWGGGIA